MGEDKALLSLPDGQLLLGKTVDVARSLTPAIFIVTPWAERYQPVIAPIAPEVRWIEDRQASGPLAGFSQVWPQIQADWCLLLACDLPNLDAQVLQQWWAWILDRKAIANLPAASLVKGSKGWEPLCGYYHRSCVPSLNQHLAAGERAFQSWLSALEIAAYSAVPNAMLFNCNTPADWRQVRR